MNMIGLLSAALLFRFTPMDKELPVLFQGIALEQALAHDHRAFPGELGANREYEYMPHSHMS